MWTAIAAGIIALIAGAFGITVYAKNRRISELETDKRNLSIGKAYAEEEAKKQSQRADAAEAGKDLNVRIASALRDNPADYPVTSSLARSARDYLASGGRLPVTTGYLTIRR